MNFSDQNVFEDSDLDINLTPLIDIVFLLLIFFMVSTTFIESRGITVELPAASAKTENTPNEPFEVSIRADERLFVGTEQATLQEIEKRLTALPKSTSVVIRADKNVHHGLVVSIMDAAHQAGLQKLAVATAPAS